MVDAECSQGLSPQDLSLACSLRKLDVGCVGDLIRFVQHLLNPKTLLGASLTRVLWISLNHAPWFTCAGKMMWSPAQKERSVLPKVVATTDQAETQVLDTRSLLNE